MKSALDFWRVGLLCLLAVLPARALPPGYHLVWGDEFSGTNINSTKWSFGALPWGGNYHNSQYASYITPEDSYLNGTGSLIVRCRNIGTTINGTWIPWTEGFVHSNRKFRFTYGYAEVRARFPVNKGTWPAFWTLSDGWPPEFDIAEYFGDDNRMHNGFAYGTCCPVNWDSSNFYNETFDQWHTYGLEWGPGYAIWYHDGVARKTINQSYITSLSEYIILNSGMTWGFDGTTPNPNYTEFDYCRVYLAGASTPPSLTPISNRTTPTNQPTPPLPFTIGDAETSVGELTFTVTSGNTALVPNANLVVTGAGANRALTITPAANQGGSALITMSVFDGEFTTTSSFTLTVNGTNSSPSISTIADFTVPLNQPWGGRSFTVGDNETAAGTLTVSATSSNPDLIAVTNITFSGVGSNRLISVLATPGTVHSSNSAFISVTVSDGSLTAKTTFRVTLVDTDNLVPNPGFENGVTNWTSVFGGTVGASTNPLHDGDAAGKLTGRSQWYHGLGADMTGRLTSGTTYRASAWARLGSGSNDNCYISLRVLDASGTHYYQPAHAHANAAGWTRLSGDFTPVFVAPVTNVVLYVEGPSPGVDLFIDDMSVVPANPNLLVPLGSSWRYLDNNTFPGASWTATNFNDSAWASGPAQLGYGDGDEAQLVSFGPSSTSKYITTWFRTSFTVANPWAWKDLQLRLLRDDGAVVYLNGTEVFRSNLPAGVISSNTFALATVTGSDESRFYFTDVNPALLRAGNNVLAVEIHQDAVTSSDISFDLELSGVAAQPDAIVTARSVWKYNDTGANLGTAWTAPAYNDSAWPSGLGQLGYGDGDEGTVVGYGPNANAKYITTYFRRAFVIPSPNPYSQFVVRLQRDDGAIVYLNNTEIFRSNMSNGPVNYLTLAIAASAADDGNSWYSTNVPAALFVPGTNVLAAEVHQTLATSSDISFDLELLGYATNTLPALSPAMSGGNVMLQWPAWAAGYSLYSATNFTPPMTWTPVMNAPAISNGMRWIPVTPGSGPRFFRLGNP